MPAYRTGGRRQNRTGYVDHDIFEGLPVRHWRREYVTVAPPPSQENNSTQNDTWANELPWGMPKDSHLLPQHSQDLLRAARSGRIYKRPAPADDEDADAETLGDKADKKEDEMRESGFTARAWKQVPRHQEGSDIDFLAKRRKGLVSNVPKPAPAPTVVKTTIRKTDAAGNEYLQDVVVPHGQTVEGDIVSQTTIPDPNAVEATPFRRKGPVGKKGRRGPGRGRKKILPITTHVTSDPSVQGGNATSANLGPDGVKIEPNNNTTPVKNGDTDMMDDSNPASDDDEGDDGDQGDDDDDSFDALNSPSRPPRDPSQSHQIAPPNMHNIPHLDSLHTAMEGVEYAAPTKPEIERIRESEARSAGSPLKQIALTTSTVNSPLVSPIATAAPALNPVIEAPAAAPVSETVAEIIKEEVSINHAMQDIVESSAPVDLPSPPPAPTEIHEQMAVETRLEEEEEEEMLLDILENAENARIGGDVGEIPEIKGSEGVNPGPSASPMKESISPPAEPTQAYEPVVENPPPQEMPDPSPPPPQAMSEAPAASSIEEAQPAFAHEHYQSHAVMEDFPSAPEIEEITPPPQTNAAPSASPEKEQISESAPALEPEPESIQIPEPQPQSEPEPEPKTEPAPQVPAEPAPAVPEIQPTSTEPASEPIAEPQPEQIKLEEAEESKPGEQVQEQEQVPEPAPAAEAEDDDDGFPDLLGGLERNLYGGSGPPASVDEEKGEGEVKGGEEKGVELQGEGQGDAVGVVGDGDGEVAAGGVLDAEESGAVMTGDGEKEKEKDQEVAVAVAVGETNPETKAEPGIDTEGEGKKEEQSQAEAEERKESGNGEEMDIDIDVEMS
ncbi:lyr family protein [Rutstroemia sp. NJR-2017a BVV2]|nr:lyr family protein [Rutstroemia sp. NJR-2017a BVV2]PQE19668.1 lyr family protein [Rutstroemia sp. NJR-2017a BVV2]